MATSRFKIARGIAAFDFHDHYAVLGLPLTADNSLIRKRYIQIAKLLHPDVCKHAQAAKASEYLSKLVNPSYNLLTQERERTEYAAILKLLAKRLMKRNEKLNPESAIAKDLLANPSVSRYVQSVQQIAELQYTDLDRIIEHTECLSELNLVYVMMQEGYQHNAPSQEATVIQEQAPPTPPQQTVLSPAQLLRQAERYIADKQWTMALRDLRSIIQTDPTNSRAHALLGLVYMNQKLPGMAKISFQQALKYNPQEAIALENISKVSGSDSTKDKSKKGGFFGWLGGG